MKSIWKFTLTELDADGVAEIEMPLGASILTVQTQGTHICLWALVEALEPIKELRRFKVIGTGHKIRNASSLRYIGTVQQLQGPLIWHIFELKI